MADDKQERHDEVARILAADPRAHVVVAEPEAWLLTEKGLQIAKDAVGRGESPEIEPEQ
jgi:hypothetical protein